MLQVAHFIGLKAQHNTLHSGSAGLSGSWQMRKLMIFLGNIMHAASEEVSHRRLGHGAQISDLRAKLGSIKRFPHLPALLESMNMRLR